MIKTTLALVGLCLSLSVNAATVEVWRIDKNAQTATNLGSGYLASDFDADYGNWYLRSDGVVNANGIQFSTGITGNVLGMDSLNPYVANVYTESGTTWRIDRNSQTVTNIGSSYLASDFDVDYGAWYLRSDGVVNANGVQFSTGITGNVIGMDSVNPFTAHIYTDTGITWRVDRNSQTVTNIGFDYLPSDLSVDYGSWFLRSDGVMFANGVIFYSGITGKVIAIDSLNPYVANVYVSTVPVPGAVWFFASGIIGLAGIKRRHM